VYPDGGSRGATALRCGPKRSRSLTPWSRRAAGGAYWPGVAFYPAAREVSFAWSGDRCSTTPRLSLPRDRTLLLSVIALIAHYQGHGRTVNAPKRPVRGRGPGARHSGFAAAGGG